MNLKSRILIALAACCVAGAAAAETINYEYDDLHRLIHVTYQSGAWIHYEYDPVGNRLLDVMNSTPGVGYVYVGIDPAGSGVVNRDPPLEWYTLGATIVLTAVPTGVCSFDHWSGDVPTGHEHDNPLSITMSTYGYMHLVAHFDSAAGHMDEDCDADGVPDGCEWSDTNSNGVLDDCDPLIGRSVTTLVNECAYGENAPDQAFEVWDAGLPGTMLSYTIADNVDWLYCTPPGGTSTGEHDTIVVHYQTTALPVGQYAATITISDPGAGNNVQTIAVTLNVTGRAAICRNVQTLTALCTYGENASDQSFDVWNCGLPGTVLSYTISDNAGWLSCSPLDGNSAGEPPDEITVHFDADELPSGQHLATVTVSDPNAAYSPQTILVVLTVTCPSDGWLPWDMNYDGFVSLIGDVPPFVDCVYFADCYCPGPGCLCPGDCNASGFLSIVGDLQCFVDCVYFGDCDPERSMGRASLPGLFTVGGAIYSDIADPLGSGLAGVTVTVARLPDPVGGAHQNPARKGGGAWPAPGVAGSVRTSVGERGPLPPEPPGQVLPAYRTKSFGGMGLWQIDNVPPGRYVVQARRAGYVFDHVEAGVVVPGSQIEIVVSNDTEAANESIQFVASSNR